MPELGPIGWPRIFHRPSGRSRGSKSWYESLYNWGLKINPLSASCCSIPWKSLNEIISGEMAYRDIEHDAITPADEPTSSYLSSESSESLESINERVALLDPDNKGPDYKSSSIRSTTSEDSGSISEQITSKSVSAIISLLLVGKVVFSHFSVPPFRGNHWCMSCRSFYLPCWWHPRSLNLHYNCFGIFCPRRCELANYELYPRTMCCSTHYRETEWYIWAKGSLIGILCAVCCWECSLVSYCGSSSLVSFY